MTHMKVGDPVEVRWGDTVLGQAHIAALPDPFTVTIAATARVMPQALTDMPRDELKPKANGGWVLRLT
jgi:hypothetical protein